MATLVSMSCTPQRVRKMNAITRIARNTVSGWRARFQYAAAVGSRQPARLDTLAFQIDLWSAQGELPRNLGEADVRQKEIQFSSRARAATDQYKRAQKLRIAFARISRFREVERRFSREKSLCCSHFSRNCLGMLTGKMFRGTGSFWGVTGNLAVRENGRYHQYRQKRRLAHAGAGLPKTSAQLSMLIDGVDWRAPERQWRPAVAG